VFERAARAGGAFLHAGKAPLFQEVRARAFSLERYVNDMVALCTHRGVVFRYATDVARAPDVLAPFDRVVIASGAHYRFGLGGVATALLDAGAAHWPGLRQVFSNPAFRDWFYYRGRRATGDDLRNLARPGQKVVVIGDAAKAGKSRDAIASAFEAALLG
jgi:hypothetical protein